MYRCCPSGRTIKKRGLADTSVWTCLWRGLVTGIQFIYVALSQGAWQGCDNRHRPIRVGASRCREGSGLLPPNRFDIFPTKEKTDLFSDVRFIPVIANVCLSFLTDMIPSRPRSYETVSIYASFLSPGGPICVMKLFLGAVSYSFQQFSVVLSTFENTHLMDGNLIQFYQSF